MKCPYCGSTLIKNNYGDLICPNCGLIEINKLNGEERANYIG